MIRQIPDARLAFHMHRVSASVCRVTHLARLFPTPVLDVFAGRFDDDQRRALVDMSHVPITPDASTQISLPLRHGGLGFTPLEFIAAAAHVASLLDTAEARSALMHRTNGAATTATLTADVEPLLAPLLPRLHALPDVPAVTAAVVQEHPTRSQKLLTEGLFARRAAQYWRDPGCDAGPVLSEREYLLRRGRKLALTTPAATAFFTASYSATGYVSSRSWSYIVRRILGFHVYAAPAASLWCSACEHAPHPRRVPLDRDGHHALACGSGYGWYARHKAVALALYRDVLPKSGLACEWEKLHIVPGADLRPADVYVVEAPASASVAPPRPRALDVTVVTVYPSVTGALDHRA